MPGSGFLYEPRHTRPLSRGRFLLRLLKHALFAQALVLVSLGIGMWGYGRFEGMAWRDAFLNSAMLLGGMGPVRTEGSPTPASCSPACTRCTRGSCSSSSSASCWPR